MTTFTGKVKANERMRKEGVLREGGQVWSKNSPSSDTFAPSATSILFDAPLLLFPAVFYCK